MFNPRLLVYLLLSVMLLLAGCTAEYPESCPQSTPVGLSDAGEIAGDDSLPFRFPLDESMVDYNLFFGWFGVSNECTPDIKDCYEFPEVEYHAAEDYKRPAGTPVYAMADGRVSFSGTAGGYGWLIIIDHPQFNLYSLYGHLSPSRWKLPSGTNVRKGDLIAYLGDPDENGGSAESPLEPHLHFGIRAGQMADYPSRGEWRYMAGWIRLCPQDLGWLQPSLVITSQAIPSGGYPQPEVDFLTLWGQELLITGFYTLCGAAIFYYAIRRNLRFMFFFPGALLILAGFVLHAQRVLGSYALLCIGSVLFILGVVLYIRRNVRQQEELTI